MCANFYEKHKNQLQVSQETSNGTPITRQCRSVSDDMIPEMREHEFQKKLFYSILYLATPHCLTYTITAFYIRNRVP